MKAHGHNHTQTARCSSNGKKGLHFPRDSIENVVGKVLGNWLGHELANECQGSPVKSVSELRFAHACVRSALTFAVRGPQGIANERSAAFSESRKFLHVRLTKSCNLQAIQRRN